MKHRPWMMFLAQWGQVLASLRDWARLFFLLLLSFSCLLVFNSIATLLSVTSVTIMRLAIPWSLTLAIVGGYSVLIKCPVRQHGVLLIIIIEDWILSILTLSAACSTARVVDPLIHSNGSYCPASVCSRYQISAAMAFLTQFLSTASSLFNLWFLFS